MEEKSDRTLIQQVLGWLKENFSVSPKDAGELAFSGLLGKNHVLVLFCGLCPALATTTSLQNGLAMGLTTALVLLCSGLVLSLLRKLIFREARLIACLVVIAMFTTVVDLLMQAFLPALSDSLDLYIPLIAVNCIILKQVESFACENIPGRTLIDGLITGIGITCVLSVLGAIREILGAGTIWGHPLPVLSTYPVSLVLSPCGGFIVLGCLAALVQHLLRKKAGGEVE